MQSISAQGTPPDAEESESPEAILDEFVEDAVEQYDGPAEDQVQSSQLPTRQGKRWKFWKKYEAGQKTRWWFASTAIPLLAATLGPLANVLVATSSSHLMPITEQAPDPLSLHLYPTGGRTSILTGGSFLPMKASPTRTLTGAIGAM